MGLDGPEAGRLIAQGLVIGVIHVLTGPDHMTAIAALTAGVPWYTSFFSGLRWGAGHSTGLLLVTIAFLSAGGSADLQEIGRYCEWVVGVVMILLGLWTLRSALKSQPPTDTPTSTQDTGDVVAFHASSSSSLLEPLLTPHHHQQGSPAGGRRGGGGGSGLSDGTHTSGTATRDTRPTTATTTATTVGENTVARMIAREYGLDDKKDHSKAAGVGGGGWGDGRAHDTGAADHGGVGGVNNLHTIVPAVPSPLPQAMPYAQAPYTYYTTALPQRENPHHHPTVQQPPPQILLQGRIHRTPPRDVAHDHQQQQPATHASMMPFSNSLAAHPREEGGPVYHAHQQPQQLEGEGFEGHAEVKDESCDTADADARARSSTQKKTVEEKSSSRSGWRAVKERVVAFVVGTVHGIAGPGGVLGVLPAVQLHDWGKAMLYLCTFCLSSMCVMGIFAAVYGDLTHRAGQLVMGRLTYYLKIFSACLSMLVGVVWIVLSALGTLDQVFG